MKQKTTKKQKKKTLNEKISIFSKTNAVTLKLQLHFLLPWEQLCQGPRHILSFPHCFWQPYSCVAMGIFNLTWLFLFVSGREQGFCQFESWAHIWQNIVDRPSGGGTMCMPSMHWSCGSFHLPNNSTASSYLYYLASWLVPDTKYPP